MPDDDAVERGVALLRFFLGESGEKKEALDLVEVVTDRPELQRRILEEWERRGPPPLKRDARPSKREVEGASCVRCGRSLSTGYFVDSSGGEVGPFGSTCIEKV